MKVKVTAFISKVNTSASTVVELYDADYEGLSEYERNQQIEEDAMDLVTQGGLVTYDWEIV